MGINGTLIGDISKELNIESIHLLECFLLLNEMVSGFHSNKMIY